MRFERPDDTTHLCRTARIGFSRENSVADPHCRSCDVKDQFVCDGSVPANGGVIPRRTIQALALRTADHMDALARRRER